MNEQKKVGLYDPSYEHDACGIGAIAQIKGIKTHKTIKDALNILIHQEQVLKIILAMVPEYYFKFLINSLEAKSLILNYQN